MIEEQNTDPQMDELEDLNKYLRPEVVNLARAMESRLRANEHKGGWRESFPQWLIFRCQAELQELDEAVDQIRANGWSPWRDEAVWHEAADVANFAMMVADVATSDKTSPRVE